MSLLFPASNVYGELFVGQVKILWVAISKVIWFINVYWLTSVTTKTLRQEGLNEQLVLFWMCYCFGKDFCYSLFGIDHILCGLVNVVGLPNLWIVSNHVNILIL